MSKYSDHNQIRFDIKIKSESTNKQIQDKLPQNKYEGMRKYLAKLDWNNMLYSLVCWNILKYVIESVSDKFVPLEKPRRMV